MKTIDFVKLIPLTGLDLTLTFSGNGAGTGKMFKNGSIVIDLTTGQASGSTLTITTPVSFRVLDIFSVHKNSTAYKWTLKNDTATISPEITVGSSGDEIDKVTKIANDKYEFTKGDDDLVISLDSTGDGIAAYYIKIQFI